MKINNLRSNDVINFHERVGIKGLKTIQILKKLYPFIANVVETQPGCDILADDIKRHEELLIKGYVDELTIEEKAEFNYLKKRIYNIANIIDKYKKMQDKIKEE